jgi:putative transposase
VPKSAQGIVGTVVRAVFAQSDATQVTVQFHRVIDQLQEKLPAAAELLIDAGADLLVFASFPNGHWHQMWSDNTQGRLNKEVRSRTTVVGIFPNRSAPIRPTGAVHAEQRDEWAIACRYMSAEMPTKARLHFVPGELGDEEVNDTELEAVS